ncbi:uncharacterized protein ACOB8E_017922 isoform 2-T2 [Sarcophilus harrisii]
MTSVLQGQIPAEHLFSPGTPRGWKPSVGRRAGALHRERNLPSRNRENFLLVLLPRRWSTTSICQLIPLRQKKRRKRRELVCITFRTRHSCLRKMTPYYQAIIFQYSKCPELNPL